MRRFLQVFAVLLLLPVYSCSSLNEDSGNDGNSIRFSVPVKSGEWSKPTYRLLNYVGVYGSNLYLFLGSDTFYWKAEDDVELTSCILNTDGTYIEDKNTVDLSATAQRVIVMTSPGAECGNNGSYTFIPMSEALYMTDPQTVQLGNYGLITFDTPLYDRRIRLKVNFYKVAGEDVEDFSIADLGIAGGGSSTSGVTYYPATKQVMPLDPAAVLPFTVTEDTAGTLDEDGNRLQFYTTEENMIASGFYAPKSTVASYLGCTSFPENVMDGGDYLYLTCRMLHGSQQADLRIALTSDTYPELLAQNNYDVNIIVKSNYINVSLKVYRSPDNDWEEETLRDNEIHEPLKIDLGNIVINGWTFINTGNNSII